MFKRSLRPWQRKYIRQLEITFISYCENEGRSHFKIKDSLKNYVDFFLKMNCYQNIYCFQLRYPCTCCAQAFAVATLLVHNAKVDMRMLNAELHRLRRPQLPKTLSFSSWMWCKCLFPKGRTNLDSICENLHAKSMGFQIVIWNQHFRFL